MPTLPQSNVGAKPLSARLSAIAEGLPRGGIVCDVGSDHGALPAYLLTTQRAERCIVTDLNAAPLARAKNNLEEQKVATRAEFVLCDGLFPVLSHSPDAVVIAGMGGETISGILSRALAEIPKGLFFALQPMTKEEPLRVFLAENGFRITDEKIVFENGKCFPIFFAVYDAVSRSLTERERFLGAFLPNKKDCDTLCYFRSLSYKLNQKAKALRSAGYDDSLERERICILDEILEVLSEDL